MVVWLLVVVAIVLVPPWVDTWVNYEGFTLQSQLGYAPLWAPPAKVFPIGRHIDWLSWGWEFGGVLLIGIVGWVLSGMRK